MIVNTRHWQIELPIQSKVGGSWSFDEGAESGGDRWLGEEPKDAEEVEEDKKTESNGLGE